MQCYYSLPIYDLTIPVDMARRESTISTVKERNGSKDGLYPVVTAAMQSPQPVPQGATYIVVKYGDTKTLINPDSAIVHIFLHLKARYEVGGRRFPNSNESSVENDSEVIIRKISPWKRVMSAMSIYYLDFLDQEANLVDLNSKDKLLIARPYITPRAEYILCLVKKGKDGSVKNIEPLVTKTTAEFKRKLEVVVKSLDRVRKTQRQPSGRAEHNRKKGSIAKQSKRH